MNKAVSIKNLTKTFKTKTKEEGLSGALKNLFNPKYKEIHAVNKISFDIAEGELVAFIGPNGAGKSTTLKILSGILYPESGEISVMGLNPQKDRQKLAYKIGTVFGQKPQLWFHLPAIDSFRLFSKIYDLPDKEAERRVAELIKRFDIADIVNQPVRKLSLGQRMRCEIVLALIHKPQILFLDEPTIGLDIVIKKNIRELIQEINEKENVTVLLTSHDMGDIEKICERAVIINKGKIVYDGSIKSLKKQYLKNKIIKALCETKATFSPMQGVKIAKKTKFGLRLEVDTSEIPLRQVISQVMKQNQILDLNIEEPPIEEIIETIYKR